MYLNARITITTIFIKSSQIDCCFLMKFANNINEWTKERINANTHTQIHKYNYCKYALWGWQAGRQANSEGTISQRSFPIVTAASLLFNAQYHAQDTTTMINSKYMQNTNTYEIQISISDQCFPIFCFLFLMFVNCLQLQWKGWKSQCLFIFGEYFRPQGRLKHWQKSQ